MRRPDSVPGAGDDTATARAAGETSRAAGETSAARREFLAAGCGVAAAAVAASVAPAARAAQSSAAAAQPAGPGELPVVDVAPLESIREGTATAFSYPDARSPALLLRLAEPARNGVGPGGSIVAFSALCTHKGCPVQYRPERRLLICPCHWSSFDPAKAGQMVIGQGSEPLPQVRLRVAGGVVQAIAIDGLIFGRRTNVA